MLEKQNEKKGNRRFMGRSVGRWCMMTVYVGMCVRVIYTYIWYSIEETYIHYVVV